jgi:hypothetical protein
MSALLTLADALQIPSWLLAQATEPAPQQSLIDKLLGHPTLSHPGTMFFAFLTTIIIVPTLAKMWVGMRTKEWEASLKLSMLERGMSAQEIQMVLDAGSGRGGPRKHGCSKSAHDNSSPAADYGPQHNV